MKKVTKPFEYDELLAMCYLSAAKIVSVLFNAEHSDNDASRKLMDMEIKEKISTWWDDPEKTND